MSEDAFESFRQALREALKGDPLGDFGAEAAVEAFNECLALAEKKGRKAERVEWCTMILEKLRENETNKNETTYP